MANFSRSLVQLIQLRHVAVDCRHPAALCSAAPPPCASSCRRIVAALALMFSLYALAGIGTESLIWGAVLALAGLPIYFWEVRRR